MRCPSSITMPNGRIARCRYGKGHPSDTSQAFGFHVAPDPQVPDGPPLAIWRDDSPGVVVLEDELEVALEPLPLELALGELMLEREAS